jgi:hypothetical protein
MDPMTEWREPTDFERRLLRRILNREPLAAAMRRQAETIRVRQIDEYGSLALAVPGRESTECAMAKIEPEGLAYDEDGAPISALVFADTEGFLKELQIFKADGSPILRLPQAETFEIL